MDLLAEIAGWIARDRARRGRRLLMGLLTRAGGVRRDQGQLRTREGVLADDRLLLQLVADAAGVTAGIFEGDRLLAAVGPTPAPVPGQLPSANPGAGGRGAGLRAADQAVAVVLGRAAELETDEPDAYAAYAPLTAPDGQVLGMAAAWASIEGAAAELEELRPALETADLAVAVAVAGAGAGETDAGTQGAASAGQPPRDADARRKAAQKIVTLLDRTTTRLRIVALNAAIISARFGQRTGFDVVAQEMGKLTAEVRGLLGTVEAALLGEELPAAPGGAAGRLPPAGGARGR
ncbi:MAG TPA: hypothetical protein VG389_26080 [Myxococcota bacterium]|jgi:hypothetical protein|nr:hypothetical protein [Myxococcota bacterium]